jgi:hypothetical protein
MKFRQKATLAMGGWPYYAYNFRNKDVKTLPRLSNNEMVEFVFQSGFVKREEYSGGISATVKLAVSEELLKKDVVVYSVRVPFKPLSEKNSPYAPKLFHGLISINIKTGDKVSYNGTFKAEKNMKLLYV